MVFPYRGEGIGGNCLEREVSNFYDYSEKQSYVKEGVLSRAFNGVKRHGAVALVGLAGLVFGGCTPEQTRGVATNLAMHTGQEKISNMINPNEVIVNNNIQTYPNPSQPPVIIRSDGRVAMPQYSGTKAFIHYTNGGYELGTLINDNGWLTWQDDVGGMDKIMTFGLEKGRKIPIDTSNLGWFSIGSKDGPRLRALAAAEMEQLVKQKRTINSNSINEGERCFSSANYHIDKNNNSAVDNDEIPVAKSIFQPGEKVRLISKWSFRKGRNASVVVKKVEGQNSSIKMSHDLGIIPADGWYLANEKKTISVRTDEEGEYLVEYFLDGRRIEGMSHSFFVNSNK